jgi:hypothetical protein
MSLLKNSWQDYEPDDALKRARRELSLTRSSVDYDRMAYWANYQERQLDLFYDTPGMGDDGERPGRLAGSGIGSSVPGATVDDEAH